MDDETVPILAGIIVLIIIILIPSLYTLAPVLSVSSSNPATVHQTIPEETATETITLNPTPTVTSLVVSATPSPTGESTPVPTPASYVTVIAKQTDPIVRHSDLQPNVLQYHQPATGSDYFTIYSLDNQEVLHALPYVSYNLTNPPLIIDYTVTPWNVTDKKYLRYKILSQVYEVDLNVNRPYEGYSFEIIVRDRDTGKIVARDGVGQTYGFESPKQLTLYKGGSYLFEFTGEYATVSLTMKVKKQGNIP